LATSTAFGFSTGFSIGFSTGFVSESGLTSAFGSSFLTGG